MKPKSFGEVGFNGIGRINQYFRSLFIIKTISRFTQDVLQVKKRGMQVEDKCEVVAQVYKCFISCDSLKSHYSFILRIGDKISAQSVIRKPLNNHTIEFNSRATLPITQLDKNRAINCQILLFQHTDNHQQSIVGIATVSRQDLRLRQKRPIRLINAFDKRASIQLNIYEHKFNEGPWKPSKIDDSNLNNLHSVHLIHHKNLVLNQLHSSRISQNKFTSNLRNNNEIFSESSGTKTCPHYLQTLMEFPTQRKFSQKMQTKHLNSNIYINQRSLDLEKPKYQVESQIKVLENRDSLIKGGYFMDGNQTLNQKDKKISRNDKISGFDRLSSQNCGLIDSIINKRNDEISSNKRHMSIHKNVNQTINLKRRTILSTNSGLVQFSTNFDYRKRISVDRESNTQHKKKCNSAVMTQNYELIDVGISTSDLWQKIDQQIQTTLKIENSAIFDEIQSQKYVKLPQDCKSIEINQEFSSQLSGPICQVSQIEQVSQISLPSASNSIHCKSLISSNDKFRSFGIVKTVELRVRQINQNINKSLWTSIKTAQNPKSKLQKIGFIHKNQLSPLCPEISQINESLRQSGDTPDVKSGNVFKQDQIDETSKRQANFQNFVIKRNDDFEMNFKINQEESLIDIDEITEEQYECFYQEKQQEANVQYSNQKDTKNLAKEAKQMEETNQYDLKKANQFLQLTNTSIAETLKATKQSFSIHISECQSNTVRKQEYQKVLIQLTQLRQQLKKIQLTKNKLNQQKMQLLTQKDKSYKQIQLLKNQKLKLTDNFKILKMQYHTLAFELAQKQSEQLQKPAINSNKSDKTSNSEIFMNKITSCGSNHEIFTFTPSKNFKTPRQMCQNLQLTKQMSQNFKYTRQMSQMQLESSQLYDNKLVSKNKKISLPKYYSSIHQRSEDQTHRKFSIGSLSEIRNNHTKMLNEQKTSSVNKMQIKFLNKTLAPKESTGNFFEANFLGQFPRKQTGLKANDKKITVGETSLFSGYPSTIIEDFMSIGDRKK